MGGKKGLVPTLRFPEFRGAGEWSSDLVKGLATTVTPPKKLTSDQYENEGSFPVIDQSQEYICGWTNDEHALVSVESPLIIFGDHTCALKIVDQPFVQGADGIKILKSKCAIEPEFLYQYLLFSPVKMESYKRHFSTLKEKLVTYPDKITGEQQKIADCFSSLDTLITAQSEKLDALKTHKKGLIQQLFPRKGETTPRLRFPEFTDQPRRKVLFGDMTEESRERKGESRSVMPVMGVSKADGIVPMEERLVSSNIARYKIVKKGWFAYNPMRLNIGSIAQWNGESDILVSPDYVVFKCLSGSGLDAEPDYINHFRHSDIWRNFVTEGGDGSVRIRIYYKDLAHLQLALPSRDEQQKIADCLSSLDTVIAAQSEKLDALKTHKKGLMQQLFPNPEAVEV